MFYFYLLKCKNGTLYAGSAKNLKNREAKHNSGLGSKYVLSRGGGKIIYSETFRKWGSALKREALIKTWPRQKKLDLIKKSKNKI